MIPGLRQNGGSNLERRVRPPRPFGDSVGGRRMSWRASLTHRRTPYSFFPMGLGGPRNPIMPGNAASGVSWSGVGVACFGATQDTRTGWGDGSDIDFSAKPYHPAMDGHQSEVVALSTRATHDTRHSLTPLLPASGLMVGLLVGSLLSNGGGTEPFHQYDAQGLGSPSPQVRLEGPPRQIDSCHTFTNTPRVGTWSELPGCTALLAACTVYIWDDDTPGWSTSHKVSGGIAYMHWGNVIGWEA